jgi:hypothetical protein
MQGVPQPTAQERAKSADFIKTQIKALVARQIWRDQGFYKVMQKDDLAIKAALKALQQNQALLGSNN